MKSSSFPPGPRNPGLLVEWLRRPVALVDRCRAEYGDLFTLRLGAKRVVLTGDPEHVRRIYEGIPLNAAPPRTGGDRRAIEALTDREVSRWPLCQPFPLLPRMRNIAGDDATARALTFCFERLLRSPDELPGLIDDISWGEEDKLDATIRESLRLRHVKPAAARRAPGPFELGGYVVPKGTLLMPSARLVHRHPEHWPEPELFRPERFLYSEVAPYAWIPFGDADRRTVTQTLFEVRTIMRVVLSRVVLAAPPYGGDVVAVRRLSRRRAQAARGGAGATAA
jgi:cytochrome P450